MRANRCKTRGSAYLMVIGAMVLCLFALLHSLKSSMQARHSQARLQDRFQVHNLSRSCLEISYNQLKASELKEDKIKKEEQIKILDGTCKYEITMRQGDIFTVKSTGEVRGLMHERINIFRAEKTHEPRNRTIKLSWSRREVTQEN